MKKNTVIFVTMLMAMIMITVIAETKAEAKNGNFNRIETNKEMIEETYERENYYIDAYAIGGIELATKCKIAYPFVIKDLMDTNAMFGFYGTDIYSETFTELTEDDILVETTGERVIAWDFNTNHGTFTRYIYF